MGKLTEPELAILRIGAFSGPEIGSNYWPFLCLEDEDGEELDGELIDSLARRGYLAARPTKKLRTSPGDAERELPDIDCRYDYDLTELGSRALSQQDGETDG